LQVKESARGDDVMEVAVSNPASPGKGVVHIRCDGLVIWESWHDLSGRADVADIVQTVAAALSCPPASPVTGIAVNGPGPDSGKESLSR
jgi:hypothetical protein